MFEVPANASGLVDPVPLTAMGRFNHEAACVDPETGMVYMTEDRDDGVLYRFIPKERGNLRAGGQLQAMAIDGLADTRNWDAPVMPVQKPYEARWIDLDEVEAPLDDLRIRAVAKGAAGSGTGRRSASKGSSASSQRSLCDPARDESNSPEPFQRARTSIDSKTK